MMSHVPPESSSDRREPDGSGAAGLVRDESRRVQFVLHEICEYTGGSVGSAAFGPRNDHFDVFGQKPLLSSHGTDRSHRTDDTTRPGDLQEGPSVESGRVHHVLTPLRISYSVSLNTYQILFIFKMVNGGPLSVP